MKSILIVALSLFAFSCSKTCDNQNKPGCKDEVPTGITCQAYFESWIYNSNTNKCEFVGYSGCGPVGFETKQECEECKCQ